MNLVHEKYTLCLLQKKRSVHGHLATVLIVAAPTALVVAAHTVLIVAGCSATVNVQAAIV